jgi:hypothetical protein
MGKDNIKPIYYKCNKNGDCYKFVFEKNIPMSQIDACLDVVGAKDCKFISEKEFLKQYEKLMDIDVLDTSNSFKIGTLTTKWLDMSNIENDSNL